MYTVSEVEMDCISKAAEKVINGFLKKIEEVWTPEKREMAFDVAIEGLSIEHACSLSIHSFGEKLYLVFINVMRRGVFMNISKETTCGPIDKIKNFLPTGEAHAKVTRQIKELLIKLDEKLEE